MNSTVCGIRTTQIARRDLMPGDILFCSDDPHGSSTYSCLYTGEGLTGTFACGESTRTIAEAEMDQFIDSLQGRFCWLLLRPSLAQCLSGRLLP